MFDNYIINTLVYNLPGESKFPLIHMYFSSTEAKSLGIFWRVGFSISSKNTRDISHLKCIKMLLKS